MIPFLDIHRFHIGSSGLKVCPWHVHISVWHCKVESGQLEILMLLVHACCEDYEGGLEADRKWQNMILNQMSVLPLEALLCQDEHHFHCTSQ